MLLFVYICEQVFVHTHEQVFGHVLISFGYIPRSGIAGIFKYLRIKVAFRRLLFEILRHFLECGHKVRKQVIHSLMHVFTWIRQFEFSDTCYSVIHYIIYQSSLKATVLNEEFFSLS